LKTFIISKVCDPDIESGKVPESEEEFPPKVPGGLEKLLIFKFRLVRI